MNKMTKIISGIIAGGLILSAGSIALANSDNLPAKGKGGKRPVFEQKMPGGRIGHEYKGGKGEESIKALVSDGTLTQAEGEKIQALIAKKQEEMKSNMEKIKNMTPDERKAYFEKMRKEGAQKKQDIFSESVMEGILTQEKADAAKDRLKVMAQEKVKKSMTDSLNSLVQKGTINEDQAKKVAEYMEKKASDRKAEFEKMKSMTEEQRREYMKNNLSKKEGILDELVNNTVITKEQAAEIEKVLHHGGPGGKFKGGKSPGRGGMRKDISKNPQAQ